MRAWWWTWRLSTIDAGVTDQFRLIGVGFSLFGCRPATRSCDRGTRGRLGLALHEPGHGIRAQRTASFPPDDKFLGFPVCDEPRNRGHLRAAVSANRHRQ